MAFYQILFIWQSYIYYNNPGIWYLWTYSRNRISFLEIYYLPFLLYLYLYRYWDRDSPVCYQEGIYVGEDSMLWRTHYLTGAIIIEAIRGFIILIFYFYFSFIFILF